MRSYAIVGHGDSLALLESKALASLLRQSVLKAKIDLDACRRAALEAPAALQRGSCGA